jgi:drug/metabolite transporter (DMT)-like permease
MRSEHLKWTFLVILSLIWGSSFILIKKGLVGLSPLQLGSLRIVISTFVIGLIGYRSFKAISRTQWKWLLLTGLLGTFFPSFLFAFAETEIDSGVVSVLNSLVPLNTILFGMAVFKITTTSSQVLGVVTGFIGAAVLILDGVELNPNQNYWYATLVLLATLMYAANVNIIKHRLQAVSAVNITLGNFITIIVPAGMVLISTGFFSIENLKDEVVISSVGYIVLLSVFGTVLAKIMFNKLIQISTPVFASSVTYLMPLVALTWGLIDGERFGYYQLTATALILCGIYMANKKTQSQ